MINNYLNLKNRYTMLPQSIKATVWFTFCNFLLQGISFMTVPIFSRLLTTDEYGQLSLYVTYQQFLLILATFEYSSGTYQRGLIKHKDDICFFTKAVQMLSSINVLVVFVICLIIYQPLMSVLEMPFSMFAVLFVFFMVQPAYQAWMNKKRFDYSYRPTVILTLIYSLLSTVVALIVVWKLDNSAYVKMMATLIVQIAICVPFYIKNIYIAPLLADRNKTIRYFKESLCLQIPLVLHSLSYLILGQSDRFMIGQMTNKSNVAVYSVAYSIAMVVTIFQQSVNLVLRPWRYKILEQKRYSELKQNTNTLLVLFGIVVLLFILVAPEVIVLLFEPVYYEAVWIIPIVSLSVFFILLYSIFTDVETYLGKTIYIAIVSISCAVLNIVLNYFGIKMLGYMACAYTTLLCYILFAVFHYFFMRKVIGGNKCSMAFDGKFLLSCSLLMCLAVGGIFIGYSYRIVRWSLIALILIIAVCNRKKFTDLFKVKKNT